MTRQKQPNVIEFAGLPGAGKTTVARRVVEILNSRGAACPSQEWINHWKTSIGLRRKPEDQRFPHWIEQFLRATRFGRWAIVHPGQTAEMCRFGVRLNRSVRPERSRVVRVLYNNGLRLRACRHFSQYDLVLFDEAIFHHAYTRIIRNPDIDADAIGRALVRIADELGTHVFWFDVDLDTTVERIVRRSEHLPLNERISYVDRQTPDETRELLGNVMHIYRSWIEAYRRHAPSRVFDVDANITVDEAVEYAVSCCEGLINERSGNAPVTAPS